MKVCLVNPLDSVCEDRQWDEPLGLLYIAACLERAGVDVEVVDLNFSEDWKAQLRGIEADVYGVYCSSSLYSSAVEVAGFLRGHKPYDVLVVGGPHATVEPDSLASFFDYVIVGEGETGIFQALNEDRDRIVKSPLVGNLDSLPFPARHLVKANSYHRRIAGLRSFGLLTSRGCPGRCVFCSKVWGKTVRFRSPINVLAEVKECIDKFGVRAFSIRDDTFTLNKQRLRAILCGFHALGVTWRCLTRTDQVDREILQDMKDSGCAEVAFGIESGSQQILNNLQKDTTVEQNARAIDMAKQVGLRVKAAVIVGSPGESWSTIEQTARFIKEHTPDQILVCTFTPNPGSLAWQHPEQLGLKILNRDVSSYQALGPKMSGSVVSETQFMTAAELGRAHDYLIKIFGRMGIIA